MLKQICSFVVVIETELRGRFRGPGRISGNSPEISGPWMFQFDFQRMSEKNGEKLGDLGVITA